MKYILYKIYQFWKLFSFGLSNMEYRAAYTLAGVLLINLYTIAINFSFAIPDLGNAWGLVFVVLWLFLVSQLFLRTYKIESSQDRYRDESTLSLIVGSFVVILYVLLSIYFFIDSLSR